MCRQTVKTQPTTQTNNHKKKFVAVSEANRHPPLPLSNKKPTAPKQPKIHQNVNVTKTHKFPNHTLSNVCVAPTGGTTPTPPPLQVSLCFV